MQAVVVSLAQRRNRELINALKTMLAHAETGELTDFAGEIRDRHGETFTIRYGVYKGDGALSDLGFRLQMRAAYPATNRQEN